MLIIVPEHAEWDLRHWRVCHRIDELNATRIPLDRMRERALDAMEAFAAEGDCVAGTSWGKDSTVLAHLVADLRRTRGVRNIQLYWVRIEPIANPHCVLVRDRFLADHGMYVDYIEAPGECWLTQSGPMIDDVERWTLMDAAYEDATRQTLGAGFWRLRRMTGIRAEESAVRRLRMRRWGVSSVTACAPIGFWNAEHVFAYLHRYRLPVHPSYAMTMGGGLDRHWLRVACLGGPEGTNRGRAEWEARYYGWRFAEIRAMQRSR